MLLLTMTKKLAIKIVSIVAAATLILGTIVGVTSKSSNKSGDKSNNASPGKKTNISQTQKNADTQNPASTTGGNNSTSTEVPSKDSNPIPDNKSSLITSIPTIDDNNSKLTRELGSISISPETINVNTPDIYANNSFMDIDTKVPIENIKELQQSQANNALLAKTEENEQESELSDLTTQNIENGNSSPSVNQSPSPIATSSNLIDGSNDSSESSSLPTNWAEQLDNSFTHHSKNDSKNPDDATSSKLVSTSIHENTPSANHNALPDSLISTSSSDDVNDSSNKSTEELDTQNNISQVKSDESAHNGLPNNEDLNNSNAPSSSLKSNGSTTTPPSPVVLDGANRVTEEDKDSYSNEPNGLASIDHIKSTEPALPNVNNNLSEQSYSNNNLYGEQPYETAHNSKMIRDLVAKSNKVEEKISHLEDLSDLLRASIAPIAATLNKQVTSLKSLVSLYQQSIQHISPQLNDTKKSFTETGNANISIQSLNQQLWDSLKNFINTCIKYYYLIGQNNKLKEQIDACNYQRDILNTNISIVNSSLTDIPSSLKISSENQSFDIDNLVDINPYVPESFNISITDSDKSSLTLSEQREILENKMNAISTDLQTVQENIQKAKSSMSSDPQELAKLEIFQQEPLTAQYLSLTDALKILKIFENHISAQHDNATNSRV